VNRFLDRIAPCDAVDVVFVPSLDASMTDGQLLYWQDQKQSQRNTGTTTEPKHWNVGAEQRLRRRQKSVEGATTRHVASAKTRRGSSERQRGENARGGEDGPGPGGPAGDVPAEDVQIDRAERRKRERSSGPPACGCRKSPQLCRQLSRHGHVFRSAGCCHTSRSRVRDTRGDAVDQTS